MRIGEAAEAAGLTPRALRYYEQRGLLSARRTRSGHRDYGPDDVRKLRAVRELLDVGLTIADVQALAHFLDLSPAGAARAIADHGPGGCPPAEVAMRRLADLDARIARLTALRELLAGTLAHRFGGLFHGSDGNPEQAA